MVLTRSQYNLALVEVCCTCRTQRALWLNSQLQVAANTPPRVSGSQRRSRAIY